MSAEERETTISFTEADADAQIYTCNRKFKSRLKKMGFEVEETDRLGGELYTIPREYIQLRKPRTMSDEEKAEAKERMAKIREEHGIGEFAKGKKKKAAPKKTKKTRVVEEEEDDEEDEELEDEEVEDEELEDDDDDEEEEVEVVKPKSKKKATTKRKPVAKKKSKK